MMNFRALFKQGGLLLLLGLGVILAGCGGSSESSSSSSFTPSNSAAINLDTALGSTGPSYQIVISRSGTATYTNYVGQAAAPQTGSGTISASLASQFFVNLDAIAPNPQPTPTIVGGTSTGNDTVSYSGKVIQLGPSTDPQ